MFRPAIVHFCLLVTPAALVTWSTLSSKISNDNFEPIEYAPMQMQRMNAYIPLARLGQPLLTQKRPLTETQVSRAAQLWIDGYREGTLQDLQSVAYDDSSVEGVKAAIFLQKHILAQRLLHFAKKATNPTAATNLALKCMELSQVAKYSDLQAVQTASRIQCAAVEVLAEAVPKLDLQSRESVGLDLRALLDAQKPVLTLARTTEGQYASWCRRSGTTPLQMDDLSKALANGQSGRILVAAVGPGVPPFMSAAEMSSSYEAELTAGTKAVLKEIAESPARTTRSQ